MNSTERPRLVEISVALRELEKSELLSQGTHHSQNFRYKTSKSPLLKRLSVYLTPHFARKSKTIKCTFPSFPFIRERIIRTNTYSNFYAFEGLQRALTLPRTDNLRTPLPIEQRIAEALGLGPCRSLGEKP